METQKEGNVQDSSGNLGLGLLWIFVIPVLSLLFLYYCVWRIDGVILSDIKENINKIEDISVFEKERVVEHYARNPMSRISSGQSVQYKDFDYRPSKELDLNYQILGAGIYLAECLIFANLIFIAFKFLFSVLIKCSGRFVYPVFYIGWNIVKLFSSLRVVLQAVLIVFCAFCFTAFIYETRFSRIILFAIGFLIFIPVLMILLNIFSWSSARFQIKADLLKKQESPNLWEKLTEIAAKINAPLPDQVIIGFNDQFFVTESKIQLEHTKIKGRTLYLSLPLLRVLNRSESEAIFAHELAHFSGNDTRYALKIEPLMKDCQNYLEVVGKDPFMWPTKSIMDFFASAFKGLVGADKKAREYRADRFAAEVTSPLTFSSGLQKISIYSRFYRDLERKILEKDSSIQGLNLPEVVRKLFWDFNRDILPHLDQSEFHVSHPFDSHPSCTERFHALGIKTIPCLGVDFEEPELDQTWIPLIGGALELEKKYWSQYSGEVKDFHKTSLAYRYLPITDEERVYVETLFPTETIKGKSEHPLVITCDSIWFPDKGEEFLFEEIKKGYFEEDLVLATLNLHFKGDEFVYEKLALKGFDKKPAEIFDIFAKYFDRYNQARAYLAKKRLEEAQDEIVNNDGAKQDNETLGTVES